MTPEVPGSRMAAEVLGTACTNAGCYDVPAKPVITLWGHGNICWPPGFRLREWRGHKGPDILCSPGRASRAVGPWTSSAISSCKPWQLREWLQTGWVTTSSCRCIKLPLVKVRLICKIKQLGPLRCDKRSGAVLRAAKGKDLPVPNLPTSIMVSVCGGSTEAKQCCQTFAPREKCIFLWEISREELLRATPSQPRRSSAFTGKSVLGASLGHATLTGFCSLALYTHCLPPAKNPPVLLAMWHFPV